MSLDLWNPTLMTFRTFNIKIIWKAHKIKKFDMFNIALKLIQVDSRIKLAIISD